MSSLFSGEQTNPLVLEPWCSVAAIAALNICCSRLKACNWIAIRVSESVFVVNVFHCTAEQLFHTICLLQMQTRDNGKLFVLSEAHLSH